MTSAATRPGRPASRSDGERSRERILDTAEQLLAQHGYAGTGIAAISRGSGLAASSIYWFFENKQDLTAAVIERAADRWLTALEAEVDAEGPPELRLRRLLRHGFQHMGERIPLFLRLSILLGLELDTTEPVIMERLLRIRARAGHSMQTALEGLFMQIAPDRAGELATAMVPLALSFAEGAAVTRNLDPGSIDFERLSEELEVVFLALARARLQESTA
jgi:AcrR family transcriptional regulator